MRATNPRTALILVLCAAVGATGFSGGATPGDFALTCAAPGTEPVLPADAPRFDLEPELRAGAALEDGELAFGWISDLAVDRHGRILAADPVSDRITILDQHGSFVRHVGRQGDAPRLAHYRPDRRRCRRRRTPRTVPADGDPWRPCVRRGA